jgi:orotate phosphoribosyltransferase
MDARTELADILKKKSLFHGDFVLASGRRTSYYFDCKQTTYSDPRGLELAAALILEHLRPLQHRIKGIGGLTLGAAPLAVEVSQRALREGWTLPAFVVRKEPKRHGRQRLIEGAIDPSWAVAIVDDVITSGDSVLRAIEAVEAEGATVARVVVLVDRKEGGAETVRSKGYDYAAIFEFDELIDR